VAASSSIRDIDTGHGGRALRSRKTRELAEAAAQIEHLQVREIRQQAMQGGNFQYAVQTCVVVAKRFIAFEEGRIVVNVLRRQGDS
jgi:hypothetical protein